MKLVQKSVYLEYTRSLTLESLLVLNCLDNHSQSWAGNPHCQTQSFVSIILPLLFRWYKWHWFLLRTLLISLTTLHPPVKTFIHFLTTPAVFPSPELTLGLFLKGSMYFSSCYIFSFLVLIISGIYFPTKLKTLHGLKSRILLPNLLINI